MLKKALFSILFCQVFFIQSQSVAISIDDVPNTTSYKSLGYSALLKTLDSLQIPVSIFINEGLIEKTASIEKNKELLSAWASRPYITLGNHGYSHSRYSEISIDSFKQEVVLGQKLTKKLAHKYNKSLNYFRFPYNDLGKDSLEHKKAEAYLKATKYYSTPFTIESSDWLFNTVYLHYLKEGDNKAAKETAEAYVQHTLAKFTYFEDLVKNEYGGKVPHIYLCHDNLLNARYLPKIITQLKEKNYGFISLEEALENPIYDQENNYYKKWGVSWIYRWIKDAKKRSNYMKSAPEEGATFKKYQAITE